MFSRKTFYSHIRQSLFAGKLRQSQVDGMEAILDEVLSTGPTLVRHSERLAYIMATTYHETAKRMSPVRETLAKTDEQAIRRLRKYKYSRVHKDTGVAYFGRGFVQLTWRENYDRMSKEVGLNLVREPGLTMHPSVSAKILVTGMDHGLFTGLSLEDCLNYDRQLDPMKARKVINGTDKAELIARYYFKFKEAAQLSYRGDERWI